MSTPVEPATGRRVPAIERVAKVERPVASHNVDDKIDVAPAVIVGSDLQAEYESWGSPPLSTPEDVKALLQRQLKHGQIDGPLFEFLVQTQASLMGTTPTAIRGLLGAWPPVVSRPPSGTVRDGFILE